MSTHNPIVISSGHGKYIRGASGYLDEVDEARKVVNRVAELLRDGDIDVEVFHDNTSHDQNTNLNTIVNYHNAQERQLDVSVHFNAYQTTSKPMGVECLYVTQSTLAGEVSHAIARAGGFIDRGPKKRTDLFFLNNTEEAAILIETCFCDSKADHDLYLQHFEAICQSIAEAIAGHSLDPPGPDPEPPDPEPEPPDDSGLPPKFPDDVIAQISQIAASSLIASYSWKDRGRSPPGYIKGMAIAYAQAVERFDANDPVMLEMAKADTYDDDVDALSWYRSNFTAIGLSNANAGLDTLRHLYVLLLGLGMRESSGKHCEGRDQSASNTSSDTAEAGLFQTSWNAHNCSDQFDTLADQYDKSSVQGYMSVFAEGVSCSSSSWDCYGSGAGYDFQETCKWSPVYAVETCAITLRNLRQHYGPINRKEAEIRTDSDTMFKAVEDYVRGLPGPGPEPEPEPPPADLEALLEAKPDDPARDPHVQWLTDSMDYVLRHLPS
jgi:hypothetical protein